MKRQEANSLENITWSVLGKQNIQGKKVYSKKKCFETMQRHAVFFVQQLQEIKFAIRQQEKPSQQGLKCKISTLVFKLFLGKGFAL